jgi:CHAT domain-containing protein
VSPSAVFNDIGVDLQKLRALEPLPETVDEVCTVARALSAPDSSMYLGGRFTESAIRSMSERGVLARARILHFATHGLLAGETRRLQSAKAEPALVATPPSAVSDRDDGLIGVSDIMQLKLDADWVVLSACNTASGGRDGSDAEALSGLARAFFYAGARALLVSHWAVDSQATAALITTTFARLRNRPEMPRAEALRHSIEAMLASGEPHPNLWAAFTVVGEGGL